LKQELDMFQADEKIPCSRASVILCFSIIYLIVTLGCGRQDRKPNIVFISMDTLRADTLGFFGYEKPTSPNMDRLFKESVVFKKAYAEEPHTLPSHVSLFTSLHPISHGVQGLMAGGIPLSKEITTLTGVLKRNGYTTAAFINGGFLHPRFGLDRGFDLYDYFGDTEENGQSATGVSGRNAEELNEVIFEWLDQHGNELFFLFVHYFDIHSDWEQLPYDSPRAYREMFCNDYKGDFKGGDETKNASQYLTKVNCQGIRLDPDTTDYIKSLYDAGVRYTDDRFGDFIRSLKDRNLYKDTLVVLLSDHGEEFMEHGKVLHTQLYEECMHVPIAFKFPGDDAPPPVEIETHARIMDIMPTVLDYTEMEPPDLMQGNSLLPVISGDVAGKDADPLFFFSSGTGTLAMMKSEWKLILQPNKRSAILYNLRADPLERTNLAGAERQKVNRFVKVLRGWYHSLPTPYKDSVNERVTLNNDTRMRLKALGYLK